MNSFDKKAFGGNVGLKIDVFDSVGWNFLIVGLNIFGFCSILSNWISTILKSARIHILMNGNPTGFFSCGTGIRQGDQLSPLFFLFFWVLLRKFLSITDVDSDFHYIRTVIFLRKVSSFVLDTLPLVCGIEFKLIFILHWLIIDGLLAILTCPFGMIIGVKLC